MQREPRFQIKSDIPSNDFATFLKQSQNGVLKILSLAYVGSAFGLKTGQTAADIPQKIKNTCSENLGFKKHEIPSLGRLLAPLWTRLGPSGASLGASCAPLGRSGAPFVLFCIALGAPWASLGALWGRVGALLPLVGVTWCPLAFRGVPAALPGGALRD